MTEYEDSLEERVEQLEAENREIRALVEALHKRVNTLDDDGGPSSGERDSLKGAYGLDRIDANALSAIADSTEPGEPVGLDDVRRAYSRAANISRNDTLKRRWRTLRNRGPFETRNGQQVFVGIDGGDE